MDALTLYTGIALVAAHVLGEALRGWASGRGGHLVSVALAIVALSYVVAGMWTLWPVPIFAGLLFGVVQLAHARRPETARAWATVQIVVLIAIGVIATSVLPLFLAFDVAPHSEPVWSLRSLAAVVVVTGLVATLRLGSVFMNIAIRPFAVQMRGPEVIEKGGKVIEPLEGGFRDAGRIIGYYERLLIFLFVLADAPVAIGFLVAAKSVFRFGDLTDGASRKNAEYLIIGTLMSFAYALVASYSTRFVFRLLTVG